MVVYTLISVLDVKAEEAGIQIQSQLSRKFQVTLGYIRPYFKMPKKEKVFLKIPSFSLLNPNFRGTLGFQIL